MLKWDTEEPEQLTKASSFRRAPSLQKSSAGLLGSSFNSRTSADYGISPTLSRRASMDTKPREAVQFDGWNHFVDNGHLNNPAISEDKVGKGRPFLEPQNSVGSPPGQGTGLGLASSSLTNALKKEIGVPMSGVPPIPPVIREADEWDPFQSS